MIGRRGQVHFDVPSNDRQRNKVETFLVLLPNSGQVGRHPTGALALFAEEVCGLGEPGVRSDLPRSHLALFFSETLPSGLVLLLGPARSGKEQASGSSPPPAAVLGLIAAIAGGPAGLC